MSEKNVEDDPVQRIASKAAEFCSSFADTLVYCGDIRALDGKEFKALVETLDTEFPRCRCGTQLKPSMENVIWAINLTLSAWQGKLHKEKADDREQPKELVLLEKYIIPSVKSAFEKGKERAHREERKSYE